MEKAGLPSLRWGTELSADGLSMDLTGADELAITIPVFLFDGERKTSIAADKKSISVIFDGWTCRYSTSGEFVDTGLVYANRNGHYRRFEARGENRLQMSIAIKPSNSQTFKPCNALAKFTGSR